MNNEKLERGNSLQHRIDGLKSDIGRIEQHGSKACVSLMYARLSHEVASEIYKMVVEDLRLQLLETQQEFDKL